MMTKRQAKLGDQIRQAIGACGMSRYAIYKATGIDQGALSRFMAGTRGLELANLERIAELLDLRIAGPKRPRKGQKGRKGHGIGNQ